jgi:hypothetical protein
MTAQTSDRVSSIAARYTKITGDTLMGMTAKPSSAAIAANDIRTMAASLLRQDEVKGIRKLLKKAGL